MKNFILLSFIAGLCILLISCEEENFSPDQNSLTAETIEVGQVTGNWNVISFFDDEDDETDSFSGISFTFSQDGTFLILRNGNELTDGTWELNTNRDKVYILVPSLSNETEQFGDDIYEIHDSWNVSFQNENRLTLFSDDERFVLSR